MFQEFICKNMETTINVKINNNNTNDLSKLMTVQQEVVG